MTGRERLHRRFCSFWWRLRHGRPERQFSVSSVGIRPRHLVIVLPADFSDLEPALPAVGLLIERLAPQRATVVVAENFRNWLPRTSAWQQHTLDLNARNWLGFPKPDVLRKVRELDADVVVDLTPRFHPFTNALAAASEAPLRVSLCAEDWNCYHNYLVKLDGSKPLAERYDVLLRYV